MSELLIEAAAFVALLAGGVALVVVSKEISDRVQNFFSHD